jgi:hypothetical protein
VATTRAVYPQTDPNGVKILFAEPHEAYEQIGVVTATGGSVATETQMYRKLQAEAAKVGADAVIVGAKDTSYWSGKNISGSAIKFTHVNSAKDGGTVAPKGAK